MKFFTLLFLIPFAIHCEEASKILGKWRTIDDKTGKETSIVEIKLEGENIVGFINQIFNASDSGKGKLCEKCKGEMHNKRELGMKIIRDMRATNGEWFESGFILDPKNGTEYRCKIRLHSNDKELEVRGFIGLALIGRSQIWKRD